MRAEMANLRRQVASERGLDHLQWPKPSQVEPTLNDSDKQPLVVHLPLMEGISNPVPSGSNHPSTERESVTPHVVTSRVVNVSDETPRVVSTSVVRTKPILGNKQPLHTTLPPPTTQDDDGIVLVAARKQREERNEKKERNEKTRGRKAVIGTRTGDNELRVIGGRFIPVFISRLAPSTSVDEVIAYVKDVQNIEVKCAQLKTRHGSYSSFKLEVI